MNRSLTLGFIVLAACASKPSDDGKAPCLGKCDGAGGSDASGGGDPIAWSRPTRCVAKLIDDAHTALLCDGAQSSNAPSTLEVIDTATGQTEWSTSFSSSFARTVFVHGDEIWFYITDPSNGPVRRTVYRASDGGVVHDGAVATMPNDIVWDAAGNSWEVLDDGSLTSDPYWVVLKTFDTDHNMLWGQFAGAAQQGGIKRVLRGVDGNMYFAAHEQFQAVSQIHDATHPVLWEIDCGSWAVQDVILRSDGSPMVRCVSGFTLYPTQGVVDISGHKPSVVLGADADKVREANGNALLVTTSPTTLGLFTYDGAPIDKLHAATDLALDGFHGPEFGLQASAGDTGALVQTPTGVGLIDYATRALSWTEDRFFLPLAVGTTGFVGVCARPPERTVGGPTVVADHITLCGVPETGGTTWTASIPWQNYGVTSRTTEGSTSRFQGENGTYVEAVAAKRWIISSLGGTYGIVSL